MKKNRRPPECIEMTKNSIFVYFTISATKKGTRGSLNPPEDPKFVIRRSQILLQKVPNYIKEAIMDLKRKKMHDYA